MNIIAFVNDLRKAGHIVHTPDLFEGRVFNSIEQGMDFVNELGLGNGITRGENAIKNYPTAVPKIEPTRAVEPIASAPQKVTRPAPIKMFAPPACAASPPSMASNASDPTETMVITDCSGLRSASKSGNAAPTAKVAAEAKAA